MGESCKVLQNLMYFFEGFFVTDFADFWDMGMFSVKTEWQN